jgi:hypothetical protein
MQVTTHLSDLEWGPKPPWGPRGLPPTFFNVDDGRSWISVSTRQGVRRRRFLALMVGAPRSPSASTRGMSSTFSSVDGGRSQISSSGTSQGATIDVS